MEPGWDWSEWNLRTPPENSSAQIQRNRPRNRHAARGRFWKDVGRGLSFWPRPRAICPLCFYRLATIIVLSPNTHCASGVGVTIAARTMLKAASVAMSERRTVHHGRCAAASAALLSLVCVYVLFITSAVCRRARANARDVYVTTVTNAFRHYQPAVRARNPRIAAEPCSPPGVTENAGRHTP